MNQIRPNEVKNKYYNINAGLWLLKRIKSLRRTQMRLILENSIIEAKMSAQYI